jgi:hypothetical protein
MFLYERTFFVLALGLCSFMRGMDGAAPAPAMSMEAIVCSLVRGGAESGRQALASLQGGLDTGALRGETLNAVVPCGDMAPYTVVTALLAHRDVDCQAGHVLISKIFDAGANPNLGLDKDGCASQLTPLCNVKSVRMADFFVQRGARPDVPLPDGDTLLHKVMKDQSSSDALIPWCIAHGVLLKKNKAERNPLTQLN